MTTDELSKRWWWKSGGSQDVYNAMQIRVEGKLLPPDEFKGVKLEYVRAAFCYEHEARVAQKKLGTKKPVYRFKKPFPQLSQEQKDLLRKEFPSRGWKPMPWERSIRTTPKDELAQMPPDGWIDIHFWVNPSEMKRSVVLKTIGEYVDKQKKSLRVRKRPNSKIRTKAYSWKSLEIVDEYLNGTAVSERGESKESHARQVLKRTY
jgi:hypothetical protein